MLRRALPSAITMGWLAKMFPAWRRFNAATNDPERAQQRALRRILRAVAPSSYGRAHRLETIGSIDEYRQRVPVVDYESLEPWIDRICAGEAQVLSAERVRVLEPTGGSSTAHKLIPFTRSFLAEIGRATGPWLFDLHRGCPKLVGARAYWSVSAVGRQPTVTAGGVPVGLPDDTQYFSRLERWAIERMLAVPASVARIEEPDRWREETCRMLLSTEDLGLISVWSPSFLTLLMDHMAVRLEDLLRRIPAERAGAIRSGLDREGRLVGHALWPRLRVISCWADGPSAELIGHLRQWFPNTELQAKGLLATEGVVSIPYGSAPGSVLAVQSHFLEFLDLDAPGGAPLLAHQLRVGRRYSPLLSTGSGLLRYHLKDVVECVGMEAETPRIRFVDKLDNVSDLRGEKLHAEIVRTAIATAAAQVRVHPRYALLAPVDRATPHYRLYLDADVNDGRLAAFGDGVEKALRASYHYDYCRRIGQLGPVDAVRVRDGAATYLQALAERGHRLGDIKPSRLDRRRFWDEVFQVAPEASPGPGRGEAR